MVLDGKVAVITGGSRGLGFAMAQALSAAGAAVVIASRSQQSVAEAVELLRSQGRKASGMSIDVAEISQMQALAEFSRQEFGHLDIWINNAGISGPYGPTVEVAPEHYQAVVQTNILGVYNGSFTAMQYFLRQGSGKLINLIGRGYNGPVPWQNAYASSKAWVSSFTKALAMETKGSGVGVFAYNPGMVTTEFLTSPAVIEGHEAKLKALGTVIRLLARPAETAAQKIVWIASSATDGRTGLQVLGFSGFAMLKQVIREGLKMLLRRPAPEIKVRPKSVPSAKK